MRLGFIVIFFITLFATQAIGAPPKSTPQNTAKHKTAKHKTNNTSSQTKSADFEKKINWLTWDEMVKLNEKNPKKIFIDFYTDWCGWCKVLDKYTFDDSIVAGLMSKYFYCVKFNAERKDTIYFNDKEWIFVPGGRNGYHQLAAYFMRGQLSFPTMCVLTHDYKLIKDLKGYITVPQFEPEISYLGQDLWMPENTKKLEEYKQQYVSPRKTPWSPPQ